MASTENVSKRAKESGSRRSPPKGNELDGKTWVQYSISVWDDIRKSSDETRLGHPAMFPTMLVRRLIQMFLRCEQQVVLDPFVGSGSTVVAALEEGKSGIGLDISAKYIALAEQRCTEIRTLWDEGSKCQRADLHVSEADELLQYVRPNSVDLCVTSPPYWDILNQRRTADQKKVRHYGNQESDLGTVTDYQQFLGGLEGVFRRTFVALRPDSYCVVVVMDIRKKNKFFCFHADVSSRLEQIGFTFDDIIIWNRKSEYNNLRPLGYPSVFRVNKVHEFVLIFKTPGEKVKAERDERILSEIGTGSDEAES